jgi:hypothetical protein
VEELEAHPGALALFTDCSVVDDDGRPLFASGIRDLHGGDLLALAANRHLFATLALRWCVPGPVFMARREAYDPVRGVGPYREDRPFEDFDFYLRLAGAGRLRFSPRPTAVYRLHGSNAMHVLGSGWEEIRMKGLEEQMPHLRGLDRLLVRAALEIRDSGRRVVLHPRRVVWALIRRATRLLHQWRVARAVGASRRTPRSAARHDAF